MNVVMSNIGWTRCAVEVRIRTSIMRGELTSYPAAFAQIILRTSGGSSGNGEIACQLHQTGRQGRQDQLDQPDRWAQLEQLDCLGHLVYLDHLSHPIYLHLSLVSYLWMSHVSLFLQTVHQWWVESSNSLVQEKEDQTCSY